MNTPDSTFREFRNQLSRFIAKRLKDNEAVEDILQEVFLRVVRNEKSLEQARTPLAWLYTVTKSVLVDHFRKQQNIPDQNSSGIEISEIPDLSGLNDVDDQEFGKCVLPLVKNLPPKYREAVEYADLADGRQTVLAERLGVSASAAKSRVQRGRKMLKQSILSCCRIERDTRNNVVALSPDCKNQTDCC